MTAVSCEQKEEKPAVLSAPELTVRNQTASSFDVTWAAVEGADSYVYTLNGSEENATEATSVSFTELETGDYTVRVKAVAGQSESQWAEVSVTLSESGVSGEDGFELTAETDGTKLTLTIRPGDKEMPYFFDVLPESYYVKDFNSDKDAAFDGILDVAVENYGTSAFDIIAYRGDTTLRVDLAQYGELNYFVLLAGIDDNLGLTTEVTIKEVSLDINTSSNTFVVSDDEVTQTSVTVSVVPSNSDPYTFILTDSKSIEGMGQAELRRAVLPKTNPEEVSTAAETARWDNLSPATSYSILVYGYDDGVITTDVFVHEVTTKEASVDEELTFELYVELTGPQMVYMEVDPSNDEAMYFFDLIPMATYEKYKDDMVQYCLDVCETWGLSPSRYFGQFASVGKEIQEYDQLEPDTDYILFAVGMEIEFNDVTFFTPQFSEIVHTEPIGGSGGLPELTFPWFEFWSNDMDEMGVQIDPGVGGVPYVFAIINEDDYNTYYPSDLAGYFKAQYEAAAYDGTFAEYINSIAHYGYWEGTVHVASGYVYYMVAAPVTVEGNNVTFGEPHEAAYSFDLF